MVPMRTPDTIIHFKEEILTNIVLVLCFLQVLALREWKDPSPAPPPRRCQRRPSNGYDNTPLLWPLSPLTAVSAAATDAFFASLADASGAVVLGSLQARR